MASTAVSGEVFGSAMATGRGFEKLRLQRAAGWRAESGSGGRGLYKRTAVGVGSGVLPGVRTTGLLDV